ncbi:hypothetical protein OG599_31200 [Streptomyces sp. NBC_01335]|uniref:hypothetical protein n=1 Tax=Streptomyces sp. NBC_01335 TaxID=2903828 RepID=UPI002E13F740|nr:hypothetical protein OG599_31200 [Streptomyces sp. NBC_01335]
MFIGRILPAAIVLPVLVLASACSADTHEKAAEKKPAATGKESPSKQDEAAEKAAENAKKIGAVPPAELEKAALSGKTAGYEMKKVSEAEVSAGLDMKADQKECQPLASLAGGTTSIEPVSLVHRSLAPTDAENATVGSMWLASHSEKNAKQVMNDLRTALKECPKGFKTLGLAYKAVKRLGDPDLGDEAVSYDITTVVSDQSVPTTYTVVRDGGVVAAFYGVNMLDTKKAAVPENLVAAQLKSLG